MSGRAATLDPATGAIRIDGWPWPIGRGLTEAELRTLPPELMPKRQEGVVDGGVYDVPAVQLGGREVGVFLVFRDGRLFSVSLGIVGSQWWEPEAHRDNVALLKRLFPEAKAQGRHTCRAAFAGGQARAEWTANAGALGDGGASLHLRFDGEGSP